MFLVLSIAILLALNGLTLGIVDMSKMCRNRYLGEYLPHPNDCTAYIICSLQPVVRNCETGLYFDAKYKVCNWPQYVKCQQDLSVDHTNSDGDDDANVLPPIAVEVQTGEVVHPMKDYDPENIICRHFGAYFLAHPHKCRSYYLCAHGHLHQVQCGQGALWSYKRQKCEISYLAECYQKSKEEEQEISELENECFPPAETATVGHTTNSFDPKGMYNNATSMKTTTEMSASSTSSYAQANGGEALATTTNGQTKITFHTTGSYHTATATAATPAMSSASFATTANGQTTNSFQSTGSIYAATAIDTVPESINSSTSAITSAYEKATSTPLSSTGATSSSFHPTASIYAATANRTTESIKHSTVSKFTSSTKSPTPSPLLTSSKTPNSANPYVLVCPQGQQSYLAHPKDCSKYFMCIKGMPIQTSCPRGLLWDTKKSFCAQPKYVKCFQ